MVVCGKKSLTNFYTIVHEMGHLHYYMSYSRQPLIFQVCSMEIFPFMKAYYDTCLSFRTEYRLSKKA